jgi:hypothetical protein
MTNASIEYFRHIVDQQQTSSQTIAYRHILGEIFKFCGQLQKHHLGYSFLPYDPFQIPETQWI